MLIKLITGTAGRFGMRLSQRIFSIVAFTIAAGLASSAATAQTDFKITASDAAENNYFGYSVSIDGDYAIVGAHFNDDDGSNSGSAYIFVRSGTTWTEQARLTASHGRRRSFSAAAHPGS